MKPSIYYFADFLLKKGGGLITITVLLIGLFIKAQFFYGGRKLGQHFSLDEQL